MTLPLHRATLTRGLRGAAAVLTCALPLAAPAVDTTRVADMSTRAADAAPQVRDPDVARAIERQLLDDPAVPHGDIEVEVQRGIVTLQGDVDNLLERDRAERLAEVVRGVRAVVNRITVTPPRQPTAAVLVERVDRALQLDAAADALEIDVGADDRGRVLLDGTVESWAERRLAERVASGVDGVSAVENRISVSPTAPREDDDIQQDVEGRLRWDALVDDGLIRVHVVDGRVSLTGAVGSAAEKRRALRAAWVNGVRSVDGTSLQVERWARDEELRQGKYVRRSDAALLAAVEDALMADPRVAAFAVTPHVREGFVTLHGAVSNLKARRAAAQDAFNVVGVVSVRNLLEIRPAQRLRDQDLAGAVRDALRASPFLVDDDVHVSTARGVVTLDGTVGSTFEKAQAEDVASRIEGVRELRNRLDVSRASRLGNDPYVDEWRLGDFEWSGPPGSTYAVRSDREIHREIREELFWSPFVDANQVNVEVAGGVATLTGTVDSWTERRAAAENALEGGAVGVANRLEVTPPRASGDDGPGPRTIR